MNRNQADRLKTTRDLLHRLPYKNMDIGAIGKVDHLLVRRAHVWFQLGESPSQVVAPTLLHRFIIQPRPWKSPVTRPCVSPDWVMAILQAN